MNLLDIAIISIALLAAARGLAKGLVREALSMGSVVVGIFLASRLSPDLAPFLGEYVSTPGTARAAAALLIFLATLLTAWLVGRILKQMASDTIADWIDTVLGGLLGLAEGMVVCLLLVLMLATFLPDTGLYRESRLAPDLLPLATRAGAFLPESVTEAINESGNTVPSPPGKQKEQP